jgi:O-methyltransferase
MAIFCDVDSTKKMEGKMTSSSSSSLAHALIRMMNALRLNNAVKFFLKFMPETVQVQLAGVKIRAQYGDNLVPAEELKTKYRQALLLLCKELGPETLGDYLEFGVYKGTSFLCMYQALQELKLEHVRLFGFDSFDGLPDTAATEDNGIWQAGQYRSDYELTKQSLTDQGVNWQRASLVKGWFSETLNQELVQQHHMSRASVIMVDCDLYSSTKDVLNFCSPLIQDQAIIFFDDWNAEDLAEKNMGEKKAFDEFLEENPQFEAKECPELVYVKVSNVFRIFRKC